MEEVVMGVYVVDRDAVLDTLQDLRENDPFPEYRTAIREIERMPFVEAEPVVHAHWEFLNDYQSRCSYCRSEVYVDHDDEPPYCERCGAHMDEEVVCE